MGHNCFLVVIHGELPLPSDSFTYAALKPLGAERIAVNAMFGVGTDLPSAVNALDQIDRHCEPRQ